MKTHLRCTTVYDAVGYMLWAKHSRLARSEARMANLEFSLSDSGADMVTDRLGTEPLALRREQTMLIE